MIHNYFCFTPSSNSLQTPGEAAKTGAQMAFFLQLQPASSSTNLDYTGAKQTHIPLS